MRAQHASPGALLEELAAAKTGVLPSWQHDKPFLCQAFQG